MSKKTFENYKIEYQQKKLKNKPKIRHSKNTKNYLKNGPQKCDFRTHFLIFFKMDLKYRFYDPISDQQVLFLGRLKNDKYKIF